MHKENTNMCGFAYANKVVCSMHHPFGFFSSHMENLTRLTRLSKYMCNAEKLSTSNFFSLLFILGSWLKLDIKLLDMEVYKISYYMRFIGKYTHRYACTHVRDIE